MEPQDSSSIEIGDCKEASRAAKSENDFPELIKINVGGKIFEVNPRLFERVPESLLANVFNAHNWPPPQVQRHPKDPEAFFFDEDYDVFNQVLRYYRRGNVPIQALSVPGLRSDWVDVWNMPEEALPKIEESEEESEELEENEEFEQAEQLKESSESEQVEPDQEEEEQALNDVGEPDEEQEEEEEELDSDEANQSIEILFDSGDEDARQAEMALRHRALPDENAERYSVVLPSAATASIWCTVNLKKTNAADGENEEVFDDDDEETDEAEEEEEDDSDVLVFDANPANEKGQSDFEDEYEEESEDNETVASNGNDEDEMDVDQGDSRAYKAAPPAERKQRKPSSPQPEIDFVSHAAQVDTRSGRDFSPKPFEEENEESEEGDEDENSVDLQRTADSDQMDVDTASTLAVDPAHTDFSPFAAPPIVSAVGSRARIQPSVIDPEEQMKKDFPEEIVEHLDALIERFRREEYKRILRKTGGTLVRVAEPDEQYQRLKRRLLENKRYILRVARSKEEIDIRLLEPTIKDMISFEPPPDDEYIEMLRIEMLQENPIAFAAAECPQEALQRQIRRSKPVDEDQELQRAYNGKNINEYDYEDSFLAPEDDVPGGDGDPGTLPAEFVQKQYHGFEEIAPPRRESHVQARKDSAEKMPGGEAPPTRPSASKPANNFRITDISDQTHIVDDGMESAPEEPGLVDSSDSDDGDVELCEAPSAESLQQALDRINTLLAEHSSMSTVWSRKRSVSIQKDLEIIALRSKPRNGFSPYEIAGQLLTRICQLHPTLPDFPSPGSATWKHITGAAESLVKGNRYLFRNLTSRLYSTDEDESSEQFDSAQEDQKDGQKKQQKNAKKKKRKRGGAYSDSDDEYVARDRNFVSISSEEEVEGLQSQAKRVKKNQSQAKPSNRRFGNLDPNFVNRALGVSAQRENELHVREYLTNEASVNMSIDSEPTLEVGELYRGGPRVMFPALLVKNAKPHQIEAVKFMWGRCVAATLEGTGCVLADSMGLGKTFSSISFIYTFLTQNFPQQQQDASAAGAVTTRSPKRALIIVPSGLFGNWLKELNCWLPEKKRDKRASVFTLRSTSEAGEIELWFTVGGILLANNEIFRELVNKRREEFEKSLVNPGADVVVVDEAHKWLSNSKIQSAAALRVISTKRRIALTGYPMQNKVGEYYNIVEWIAPGALGTPDAFENVFTKPIISGLRPDATEAQIHAMQVRLFLFQQEIGSMVLRRDSQFLANLIKKQKREFSIFTKCSDLQRELIEALGAWAQPHIKNGAKLFLWLSQMLNQIMGIPDCFYSYLTRDKSGAKKKGDKNEPKIDTKDLIATVEQIFRKYLPYWTPETSWADSPIKHDKIMEFSGKFQVLLAIVTEAMRTRDKVVVFTQFTEVQTLLCTLLQKFNVATTGFTGATDRKRKEEAAFTFTSDSVANVFVVTTKAGSHGINLIAANRVVMFDVVFNPANEVQAAFRVYRIGQPKDVYFYRLIAAGSVEERVWAQVKGKRIISARFVDRITTTRSAVDVKIDLESICTISQDALFSSPVRLDEASKDVTKLDQSVLGSILGGIAMNWLMKIEQSENISDVDEQITETAKQEAGSRTVAEFIQAQGTAVFVKRRGKVTEAARAALAASTKSSSAASPLNYSPPSSPMRSSPPSSPVSAPVPPSLLSTTLEGSVQNFSPKAPEPPKQQLPPLLPQKQKTVEAMSISDDSSGDDEDEESEENSEGDEANVYDLRGAQFKKEALSRPNGSPCFQPRPFDSRASSGLSSQHKEPILIPDDD